MHFRWITDRQINFIFIVISTTWHLKQILLAFAIYQNKTHNFGNALGLLYQVQKTVFLPRCQLSSPGNYLQKFKLQCLMKSAFCFFFTHFDKRHASVLTNWVFYFAMYIIKVKSNSVIHPGDIIPFILVKKYPAVNHVL